MADKCPQRTWRAASQATTTASGEERLDHLLAEVTGRQATPAEPPAQRAHQGHRHPDRPGQVALGAKEFFYSRGEGDQGAGDLRPTHSVHCLLLSSSEVRSVQRCEPVMPRSPFMCAGRSPPQQGFTDPETSTRHYGQRGVKGPHRHRARDRPRHRRRPHPGQHLGRQDRTRSGGRGFRRTRNPGRLGLWLRRDTRSPANPWASPVDQADSLATCDPRRVLP